MAAPADNRTVVAATVLVTLALVTNLWTERTTAAAVADLAQVVGAAAERERALEKWEYDIVTIEDNQWQGYAQQLGMQGWEIVATRRAQGPDDTFAYECIMKRRIVP